MFNHPEYGCDIVELVGEENNDVTWARAVRSVQKAAVLEPRIADVGDIYAVAIDATRFDVYLFYELIDDKNKYNLVFPFFVR